MTGKRSSRRAQGGDPFPGKKRHQSLNVRRISCHGTPPWVESESPSSSKPNVLYQGMSFSLPAGLSNGTMKYTGSVGVRFIERYA